ncbi:MAG: EAL domain-containing protein [Betaproteobacteria bacterium]
MKKNKNIDQHSHERDSPGNLDDQESLTYQIDLQSGRYQAVSAPVAGLFGLAPKDFLHLGLGAFRRSMRAGAWRRMVVRLHRLARSHPDSRTQMEARYVLCLADGKVHYFSDRLTLESDAKGRPVMARGVVSDVTERVMIEQALRESEERFHELLGTLDEMVWCYAVDTQRVLYVNDAVERIYKRTKADFLASPRLWRTAIHHDDRALADAADHAVLESGKAECDCRIVDAAGGIHWLHFSLYRIDRDGPRNYRVVGVGIDITERKRVELALAEHEQLLSITMNSAQVGFFVVQEDKLAFVNPLLPQLFGYTAEEMIGMNPVNLTASEKRDMVMDQQRRRAAGEGGKSYESLALRKDGSTFPVMILASPTNFRGQMASVGTVFDLTERKEAEKRILELAFFDPLTKLPNRRLLEDRFNQALAQAERKRGKLAVFFLDLDNFKRVNESLGHSVGDQLLCAMADRIQKLVRKEDTAARLGGDEFIMVLPNAGAEDAAELALRFMRVCSEAFLLGPHELSITSSVGISLFPDDGRDFETLLKNADTAMYQAKEAGRQNFQFYSHNMNVATLERLLLENSLRHALADDQFMLVYQPVVALKTGEVIGCEALIRWRHPELGLVPPGRFIPVAEDTGLINGIGEWVLNEACRQAKAWQDTGLNPVTMAVNVSPVQFRQNGFVGMVAGILTSSGLDSKYLELELTERTVMHDAETNLGTLSSLHRMGVELAVDDFGTGYSSLAYLKRFPVGKLKIDQSFVRDIVEDADDLAIAATVVTIGHSLRLNVLAEGVENEQQLHLLEARHCDMAQGYHFSVPLPPGDFAELLRRQPFRKLEGKWKKW